MLTSSSHYIVAGVLARTVNPTAALAAYTLAWSLTVLFEAPGVSLRAAATAMGTNARDWGTVHRTFWSVLAVVMGVMLLLFWTPIAGLLLKQVMGVPTDLVADTVGVARITTFAVIGASLRYLYHGILVRLKSTDGILAGILARLAVMGALAWVVTRTGWPGGPVAGAVILTAGMLTEGVVAMASYLRAIRRPQQQYWTPTDVPPIKSSEILRFIAPLAISGLLVTLGRPIMNAGLVQAGALVVASFSLAITVTSLMQAPFSILHQVTMVFGVGDAVRRRQALVFAVKVGLFFSAVTAVFAYPPVGGWIFGSLIGATGDLVPGALQVMSAQIPIPLLMSLSEHYAGLLLAGGRTRAVGVGRIARFVVGVLLLLSVVRWGHPAYIGALTSASLGGGILVELLLFAGALRLGELQRASASGQASGTR